MYALCLWSHGEWAFFLEGPGPPADSYFLDPVVFKNYVDYRFVVQGLGGSLATITLPACAFLIQLKLALQAELGLDLFTAKLLVGTHMVPDWSWDLWLGAPLWMLVIPQARDILLSLAHMDVEDAQRHAETLCTQKNLLGATDASRQQLAHGYRKLEDVILTVVKRPPEVGLILDLMLGVQANQPEYGPHPFWGPDLPGDLRQNGDLQRATLAAWPEEGLRFLGGYQCVSADVGRLVFC
jgi:hypothetical protein